MMMVMMMITEQPVAMMFSPKVLLYAHVIYFVQFGKKKATYKNVYV